MDGARIDLRLAEILERAHNDGIRRLTVRGILETDGRILMLQRAEHHSIKDMLELPGGRKWDRESIGAALCREFNEETGLEITEIGDLVLSTDHTSRNGEPTRHLGFSVMAELKEVIRLSPKEHKGYLWVSHAEVPGLPIAPRSLAIVNAFMELRRAA